MHTAHRCKQSVHFSEGKTQTTGVCSSKSTMCVHDCACVFGAGFMSQLSYPITNVSFMIAVWQKNVKVLPVSSSRTYLITSTVRFLSELVSSTWGFFRHSWSTVFSRFQHSVLEVTLHFDSRFCLYSSHFLDRLCSLPWLLTWSVGIPGYHSLIAFDILARCALSFKK